MKEQKTHIHIDQIKLELKKYPTDEESIQCSPSPYQSKRLHFRQKQAEEAHEYSESSSSDSEEDKPPKEVRLLTYNIFIRPPPIKNKLNDYKDERLACMIEKIGKYDIVCFQEMFAFLTQRKHRLIKQAALRGFKYFAENPPPNYLSKQIIGGGLLTLSRYPILKSKFYTFKNGCDIDKVSAKGVLYTKINFLGCTLHLFNTHLQANYGYNWSEPRTKKSFLCRAAQLIEVREFIKETLVGEEYSKSHISMIVGDLNIDSNKNGKIKPTTYMNTFPNEFLLIPTLDIEEDKSMDNDPLEALEKPLDNFLSINNEYDMMLHLLTEGGKHEITDYLQDRFIAKKWDHIATYGDYIVRGGQKIPLETAFTWNCDYGTGMRIDYVLEFFPQIKTKLPDLRDISSETEVEVERNSCNVVKFFVKGKPFTQLSDHYGIKIKFKSQDMFTSI